MSCPFTSTVPKQRFVLGTRESKLAMIQTNMVKAALEVQWPNLDVQIFGMTTTGDNNTSTPLYLFGGKALWTKELEVAMLSKQVDAIVHCLKDVPTEFPPGCELGAIMERENPADALVVKAGLPYTSIDQFPEGSVIGTSSVRRVAHLRKQYPHLKFADVRGLVQTRLRKLDDPEGPYTAIILAAAGLIRMGLANRITATVTSPALYHAVGQGALGIEIRSDDPTSKQIVGALDDWKTSWTTRAERNMLNFLEGGCSVPVGVETYLIEQIDPAVCPVVKSGSVAIPEVTEPIMVPNGISNGLPAGHPSMKVTRTSDTHSALLTLTGSVTSLSGHKQVVITETRQVNSVEEAEAIGAHVAKELIKGGADEILAELGRHVKEVNGVDGKEIPMTSNNVRSEINTPPIRIPASSQPKTPLQTVFGSAEKCQRPVGW